MAEPLTARQLRDRAYQQRPEVKERNRLRAAARYVPKGTGVGWRKGQKLPEAERVRRRREAVRRYNNSPKGRARWNQWARENYVPVPREVAEPMPMPYVGHEVFEQAAKAARLTGTAYTVDWGQHDIMGEAVLAILEGRDPDEAIRKHRAAEKAIDRLTDRRIVDVGWDGNRVIPQWSNEDAA